MRRASASAALVDLDNLGCGAYGRDMIATRRINDNNYMYYTTTNG
jgi:hypothetical protein